MIVEAYGARTAVENLQPVDTNNAIIDAYLGLPATETGINWFELSLALRPQVVQ